MVKETKKFILKIWHNTKLQKKKTKKKNRNKKLLNFYKIFKKGSEKNTKIQNYKTTKLQN